MPRIGHANAHPKDEVRPFALAEEESRRELGAIRDVFDLGVERRSEPVDADTRALSERDLGDAALGHEDVHIGVIEISCCDSG